MNASRSARVASWSSRPRPHRRVSIRQSPAKLDPLRPGHADLPARGPRPCAPTKGSAAGLVEVLGQVVGGELDSSCAIRRPGTGRRSSPCGGGGGSRRRQTEAIGDGLRQGQCLAFGPLCAEFVFAEAVPHGRSSRSSSGRTTKGGMARARRLTAAPHRRTARTAWLVAATAAMPHRHWAIIVLSCDCWASRRPSWNRVATCW